jgi:hypothetical protein
MKSVSEHVSPARAAWMKRGSQIPAPGRDLANIPPRLPPDSYQAQPIERAVFGSLVVAISMVVLLTKLVGAIVETYPGPDQNLPAIPGDWLAVSGALCFLICGFLIFRKERISGTILPAILMVVGLVLSILSRWFAA